MRITASTRAGGATGKGPVHDDGSVGTLDFNADIRSGLDWCRLCGRAQGDRHKCLWSIDQCALAMFAQPAMYDVGVDAVPQGHPSNGCAGLGARPDNLHLELSAVEPPLAGLRGASVARHGVHDVHRAHYLWISANLQGVLTGRLPFSVWAAISTLFAGRFMEPVFIIEMTLGIG